MKLFPLSGNTTVNASYLKNIEIVLFCLISLDFLPFQIVFFLFNHLADLESV